MSKMWAALNPRVLPSTFLDPLVILGQTEAEEEPRGSAEPLLVRASTGNDGLGCPFTHEAGTNSRWVLAPLRPGVTRNVSVGLHDASPALGVAGESAGADLLRACERGDYPHRL